MFCGLVFLALLQYVTCWPDFYLYTRQNPKQLFEVTAANFKSSPYQANLETILIIHGFAAQAQQDWLENMKNIFLDQSDVNVILVDWKDGATAPNYIRARNNVDVTAKKLNQFIQQVKIDPKKIYCIGHSLGAHTCGLSAKGLVYKRITGLDPAGPMFKKSDATERLDKTDALFVDVINTDGCLGLQKSIGHKTFWPNGGSHQAGCVTDFGLCEFFAQFDLRFFPFSKSNFIACSHKRSYEYYTDSLRKGCSFKSVLCDDYEDFQKGVCKCDSSKNCASMGFNSTVGTTLGDFYLNTNTQEPFCQN